MIGILGCGWLGLPLAKELVLQGFTVKGTTTTRSKLKTIAAIGAEPYEVHVLENSIEGDVATFFSGIEVLVVDIPPGLRKATTQESYVNKIRCLSSVVKKHAIKKVLFVSSISVYGSNQGVVDEKAEAIPETESGKQLLQSEELLTTDKSFTTSVVRFAGLIGGDRHPVKFLAGKQGLDNANHYVHLIHLEDCVGLLTKILKINAFPFLLNAVYPAEISKKEYYTNQALLYKVTPPEFSNETVENKGKHVISNNVSLLNYTFKKSIFIK